MSIRTVHRNWEKCTTHCPVFPWKYVPGQQLLCQPGFLTSAKYKCVGLTAAGKAETTLSNQTHISPQDIQGMDAARSDFSSYLLDGFKVRKEKISVIVGHLVLQHRDQPLQAHPSINTLLRKGFQCPISFPAQER